MKLDAAIEQVVSSESELADALDRVGERHRVEHDVFHITETLAKAARARIQKLGKPTEPGGHDGLLSTVREKTSELIGSRPEPGMLLLRDLREIYLLASQASIDWTVLAQGAQAAKDGDVLAIVSECHTDQLRTLNWATTRIKEAAPQTLTS
jgi:hypothetical protein